jgi:hypothetical protein
MVTERGIVLNDRLKIKLPFHPGSLPVGCGTQGRKYPKKGLTRTANGSVSMWRNLAKALSGLRRSLAETGGSYRPDLHYMRGPGPKWRAKYGNLAEKPQPRAIASDSVLHAPAQHRA